MAPDSVSLILMSFLAGILVGLTSMGGAALITPFLILFVGVKPSLAIGTDLVYGAITKIAGGWMHWRQQTVEMKLVLQMAIGSVPGGIIGVYVIQYLHTTDLPVDEALRHVLGVVLVIVAVLLLARTFGYLPQNAPSWLVRHERKSTTIWGFLVGLTVGLTSVGSGSLLAPFLMMIRPNRPAHVVGTDVFHAAILVSATAMLHGQAGNVNWDLIPLLLAGSLPGVLIGSFVAPRLPARHLKVGLSVLLFATGVKLIP